MDKRKGTTRLSIEVPLTLHKQLKAVAALRGTSVKQIVIASINEYLLSENSPNLETFKALEGTDKGHGLIHCRDLSDLCNQLDLNP